MKNLASAFPLRMTCSLPAMLLAAFMAIFLMTQPGRALAGPGHDHGDEAPAAASGTASPRVQGHSDLFELVGIVDHGVMTIYLDRYGSNEPVSDARIEVESGPLKLVAAPQPDGTYRIEHELLEKPGTLAMSFTVTAGADTDLLAGDLVVPEAHHDHAHDAGPAWHVWGMRAAYGLAGLAALGLLMWFARRGAASRQALQALVLGLAVSGLAALVPQPAWAGPGHDHGDEAAAAAGGNSPRRLPDGGVFLPKPSQRQLAIRTVVVEEKALAVTVELTGVVIADPNAGGKVQPTQAGRIEAGPRGLPRLGQTVRKGEALAVVRATVSAIERGNQVAQAAELKSALELARKRVARLEQLEGSVAQKDVDAARAEVDSLTQRLDAVRPTVSATETLYAPVSGVIAASHVVAGQVVEARELLFEIVDPARLMVEAASFDAALAGNIASASASPAPGVSVPLRFIGAGRAMREGALPLHFGTAGGPATQALVVNQPVKVIVQTRTQVKGFAVTGAAVVKNPSNQDIVWVHTGAEQFQPRTVRHVALDGATVSVVDGLKPGDRVVIQGAPLVNQVR